MAEISDGRKVKLLLSINDHPEIQRLFKAFTIQRISTKYGFMNGRHWSRGVVRQELYSEITEWRRGH
ncbi:MAG: hypothetical protein HYY46_01025 [Deltaproteobacteria bacterium]|nr:hypothetical protein [Deltaproteobacteria bacterium]